MLTQLISDFRFSISRFISRIPIPEQIGNWQSEIGNKLNQHKRRTVTPSANTNRTHSSQSHTRTPLPQVVYVFSIDLSLVVKPRQPTSHPSPSAHRTPVHKVRESPRARETRSN